MVRQASAGDPRLERTITDADVRPVVALPRSGLSNPVLIVIAVVLGLALFAALNARRTTFGAPMRHERQGALIQAPPPLTLPPTAPPLVPAEPALPDPRVIVQMEPAPPPQIVYVPTPPQNLPAPQVRNASSEPALVVDSTRTDEQAEGEGASPASGEEHAPKGAYAGDAGERARATVFRNRATTVPQGTLIPAVLETALDSSRPGFARAVVSRDIRGFDGSRVLIPRGSKLIGEYQSNAAPGQTRALINWTRLIRPDGATIAIGSPVSDTLGRAGTQGDVDSHFFQRFGGAILQSVLDLGVNVATARAADGTGVVLGLTGAGSGAQAASAQATQPTIRVKQGAAIAIFVARDLDFTSVENRR